MLSIQKTLHNNQIYLLQSMPYAEHTENSVLYPDFCCRQVYLLQSMSSVSRQFRMLSIWETLHSNPIYLLQSMPYLRQPAIVFLRLSPYAPAKRKLSETVAKLSKLVPTKQGPTKSPLEFVTRLIYPGSRGARLIPMLVIQARKQSHRNSICILQYTDRPLTVAQKMTRKHHTSE